MHQQQQLLLLLCLLLSPAAAAPAAQTLAQCGVRGSPVQAAAAALCRMRL
jgi:hypothetical protein